jgi:hypothetical protein
MKGKTGTGQIGGLANWSWSLFCKMPAAQVSEE